MIHRNGLGRFITDPATPRIMVRYLERLGYTVTPPEDPESLSEPMRTAAYVSGCTEAPCLVRGAPDVGRKRWAEMCRSRVVVPLMGGPEGL